AGTSKRIALPWVTVTSWCGGLRTVPVNTSPSPPGVDPRATSGQGLQHGLGVQEVRRRVTFRVGAVDGRQRAAGVVAAALSLPQTGETHGGPQLPPPALLAPGRLDGLAKTLLGADDLVGRFGQQ